MSDLAEKTYGGGTPTTSNEAYWNGDIPWIQSSDVVDGKLLGVEPRKWITQDGLNNSAAQRIPGNSIAIITRVGVGKLAFMPYSYATSQDFLSLSKLNAEPLFTVYACYKKLQSELNAVQGTSIKGITKDELLAKNIMVPRYAEQQHIGAFFKPLDNLITLHQRECISFTTRAGRLILTANKKRNTSSWEQRKLGEIGSVSMCRRIFKEQTSETGDIPFYKIGTFGADPDAFISRELFEEYKSKYPYPQKGDILISASGSIGRTVEFAGNNEYFQDSNIVWLNHDERLSNPFLKCFYSVVKWAGIEGSTIKRLYNDNILNTVICMPSVPEQKRIGLFFENLDNLITLHQRQHFLHSTPDISLSVRLIHPFYTSSWEQRKLASLCEKFTDGDWIESKDQSDFGVRLVQTGNVGVAEYLDKTNNKKWISEDTFDRLHCEEVLPGDILISRLPEPAGRACIVPLLGTKMITAVDCTIVRTAPDMSNKFLVQYLSSQAYFDDVNTCLAGGTRQRISRGNLANFNVPIPVKKSEQDAIGMFFGYLDNLITLHQRKGKAAVSGCSNDANNSKGVCCKARDFGYKCHKKDEPNRFDA